MKKSTFLSMILWLVATALTAQPTSDMHIAKYKDNATPYPIYAGLFGSSPTYDTTAVRFLGQYFDAYYGNFDVRLATANSIRQINPNFKFIKYQGAWQLTGASRIKVERQKDQVLHYRIGNLDSAISATQTRFKIADLFGKIIASTSPLDSSISYFQSGVFRYTTWLRMGSEVMKIIAVNNTEVEVLRGFDGTPKAAYAAGIPVLSPVYGTGPVPNMREEISYRNDEATNLRWDNIYAGLEAEYNKNRGGVWIDIVVGNLSQFAQSGETVPANRIWDLANNKVYDPAYRASRSEVGIKYMQDKFKAKFGIYPVIWGNNMLFPTSLTDPRIKMLLQTEIKPRPLDGFAQENAYAGYGTGGNSGTTFNWTGYEEWKTNLRSIMYMGEQKLSAVPLTMDGGRDNGTFAQLPAERKHKLFMYNYASYLLAVKVEADNSIYTKLGFTPIVDENGKISFNLDPCFTWDIGKPTQTLASADFMQYKLANRDIWVRRFENGVVVVNPTDRDENQIDLSAFGSRFYNPDTKLNVTTTVSLPEHTGMVLFFSGSTAVDNIANSSVSVFPNPVSDSVFVQSLEKGKYIVDIFNSNATLIRSKRYDIKAQNETIQVELNDLPSGAYIVQIRSDRMGKVNIIKRLVKM